MILPRSPLDSLSVQAIAKKLATGELSITELLQACFQRIELREFQVRAWTYLDMDHAQQQATVWEQKLQQEGSQTLETFPLLGVPIAVKDIFATLEMPTGWGTEIYRNRYMGYDAAIVSKLKAAGAIILGKTVTTELATAAAGPTANPHNLAHTPGGSSSGSAAAVADGMVPIAMGSQTMGSILRPAAYCGIFGFKPSFGLISRYGMMPVAPVLDHVGVFARCLNDIHRLLTVLIGTDNRDPDCQTTKQTFSFKATSLSVRSTKDFQSIRLGLIKTSHWQQTERIAQSRLMQAITVLRQADIRVDLVALPANVDPYWNIVQTLCAHGLYQNHGALLSKAPDRCSPLLRDWLQWGKSISADTSQQACRWRYRYREQLRPIFAKYDAMLSPVTLGPAPLGLANTGSPIFCGLWTLCGLPALNIPLGKTVDGLPLGCQLVGSLYNDQKLLEIAHQCWAILSPVFGEITLPPVSFLTDEGIKQCQSHYGFEFSPGYS
ncbi:amidase [Leptothoe sp. ISB3NOV94-8A]